MEMPQGYRVELQNPSFQVNPPMPVNVMMENWVEAYFRSPQWKDWWLKTQSNEDWPAHVKVLRGKLYWKELLCIPEEWCIPVAKDFMW